MSGALNLANCKAALFDVDGTLIDSVLTIVAGLGDAYEHLFGNRPSDEKIRSLVGMPLRQQMTLFAPENTTEAEYSRMIGYTVSCYAAHKDLEHPHLDAIKALEVCRRAGLKTALVTSKNSEEVALFKKRFSFSDQVDAIVCASDVERPKPWPDSAIAACTALGVQPSEAVMIGDSLYDVRCAQAASVAMIAVTYGSSPREALEAEMPDLILDSPEQLLAYFEDALHQTPCHERN